MISNLKEKLMQISAQSEAEQVVREPLDISCTEYTNTYDTDYMVGDVAIGDAMMVDCDALAAVCMAGSDDSIGIEDIVFFDTETTGLGSSVSTVAFLVGVGYFEDDRFICRQFLMNDYHQENHMLCSLNEILSHKKAVVSYNGKAFDRHIVNNRAIMNRLIRPLESMVHLDLLHSARRLYARRIQRCSMHSIEENILGIKRINDVPGALIPEIFANYLKYGDSTMLQKVVEHNLQDIVSMTAIALKLANAYVHPHLLDRDDIFSQGRIFEKIGYQKRAIICYNMLGNSKNAIQRLAYIAKSDAKYDEAIGYFEQLTQIDKLNISHYTELAKIYEHRTKQLDMALEQVNAALMVQISLGQLGSEQDTDSLYDRKQRLMKKINANRKDK